MLCCLMKDSDVANAVIGKKKHHLGKKAVFLPLLFASVGVRSPSVRAISMPIIFAT